jgi:hypothetical protein
MDQVLADGLVAKLSEERGHSRDRRRCDLREIADAAERRLRQIPIVLLQALQERDHGFGAGTEFGDSLFYEGQV